MKRYTSSLAKRVEAKALLIFFIVFVGMYTYFLHDALTNPAHSHMVTVAIGGILIFGLMEYLSIWMLIETMTVYELDGSEIVQLAAFRKRSMRWRDVVRLDEGKVTMAGEPIRFRSPTCPGSLLKTG